MPYAHHRRQRRRDETADLSRRQSATVSSSVANVVEVG